MAYVKYYERMYGEFGTSGVKRFETLNEAKKYVNDRYKEVVTLPYTGERKILFGEYGFYAKIPYGSETCIYDYYIVDDPTLPLF